MLQKKNKPIIGGTLDRSATIKFLEQAIQVVEEKWVEQKGIYRLSASVVRMRELRSTLDKKNLVDLDNLTDANEVCSLLKMFFKHLQPEPILTFNLYESFVAAVQEPDEKERILLMQDLLKLLPEINFKVLMMLITHLHFVAQHKSQNKMDVENLAIVFGPVLLRPKVFEAETILADVTHVNEAIATLIRNEDIFFEEGGDHQDKLHINFVEKGASPTSAKLSRELPGKAFYDGWMDRSKKRRDRKEKEREKKKREKEEKDRGRKKKKEEEEEEKKALERAERKRQLRENLKKDKQQAPMLKKDNDDLFRTAEDLKSKYQLKRSDSVIHRAFKPPAAPPPPPVLRFADDGTPIEDGKKAGEDRDQLRKRFQRRASRIRKGKYTTQELTVWLEELRLSSE